MPDIDFAKLPNFFLIGASKSGTTSLHEILGQHPEVFVSQVKEPNFFCAQERFEKGLTWYQETHFMKAGKQAVRGESSGSYLYWSELVAPRIKETYGERDLKFIAIFRDPVKRAYSYYWMKKELGLENLTFKTAIEKEEQRLKENWLKLQTKGSGMYGYFRGGCYASLIRPFLNFFPRGNFHFMLLEDLQNNFETTITNLAIFLDISPDFEFKSIKKNEAAHPKNERVNRFLYHPAGPLHRLIRLITNKLNYSTRLRIKNALIHSNLQVESIPPMDTEVETALRLRYRDEIGQLEDILHRDLPQWK